MATSRYLGKTSVTSLSPSSTWPESAASRPAMIRKPVVLPQPDGPSRTRNSPGATSMSRSLTTWLAPNHLLRPRIDSRWARGAAAHRIGAAALIP